MDLPQNIFNVFPRALNAMLKWNYDQKVTLPFLLYFESMYYRYLPYLILSHDLTAKSVPRRA